MDAAGHFTCGKETRDRLTHHIHHFSLLVDGGASHAVVNLRPNPNRVERRLVDDNRELQGTMELLVIFTADVAVKFLHLGNKRGNRHSKTFRQPLKRIKLVNDVVFHPVLQGLSLGDTLGIGETDRIDRLAVLDHGENLVCPILAVCQFITETPSCTRVHHNSHRETGDRVELRYEAKTFFFRAAPRTQLDLIQLHGSRTDLKHMEKPFPCSARLIGGIQP